jgi:hypothetical protein
VASLFFGNKLLQGSTAVLQRVGVGGPSAMLRAGRWHRGKQTDTATRTPINWAVLASIVYFGHSSAHMKFIVAHTKSANTK